MLSYYRQFRLHDRIYLFMIKYIIRLKCENEELTMKPLMQVFDNHHFGAIRCV